jgi:hypothetical protein
MSVSSPIEIWGCGYNHHLIDDCARTDTEEFQDYQDRYDDLDFIYETV